jgi:hypothetical protein
MMKIPHRKEFENLYREEFAKQVKQDLIDNPKLKELFSKNNWKGKKKNGCKENSNGV